jgi:hypothetical protein
MVIPDAQRVYLSNYCTKTGYAPAGTMKCTLDRKATHRYRE